MQRRQILSRNKRVCCQAASLNTKKRLRWASFCSVSRHSEHRRAAAASCTRLPAQMLKVLRRSNKAPGAAKPTLVCRGLCCVVPPPPFFLFLNAVFQKQILARAVAAGFILDLPSYISAQSRREEIHSQTGTGCQSLRQQKPLYTRRKRRSQQLQ